MPSGADQEARGPQSAAVTIVRRGPTRSTHVPNTAALRPSITIAIEKTMPTAVSEVSKWSTSDAL